MSSKLQQCKTDVGARVQTSVLFLNLLSCMEGNNTSVYFACPTPDADYIFNAAPGPNIPVYAEVV